MDVSYHPYALNQASTNDRAILHSWIEPHKPNNTRWITHVTLGGLTFMASTMAFLGKSTKTTSYSQVGPAVTNITFEPSMFARWTTAQKCIFIAALVILGISLLVHYKIVSKNEQLAAERGITSFCFAKLKENEYTTIEVVKGTYCVFTKSERSGPLSTDSQIQTWLGNRSKGTEVAFDTLLKRS